MRSIILLLALCTLILGQTATAQNSGTSKKDIEMLRVTFLTKKLNLTLEEAQVFWPVYNAYEQELKSLKKEKKDAYKDFMQSKAELTDEGFERFVDDYLIFQTMELEIKKKYHAEFKKVLPIEKVAKLYRAEQQFKRYLLDEIKKRQANTATQNRRY